MSAMNERVLLLTLDARRTRTGGRATTQRQRSLATEVLGGLDAASQAKEAA